MPNKSDAVQFTCDSCGCDISNLVQISCAECAEYDLCVPCFASGAHSGDHKPWHSYKVIDQHSYPIFDEDWGADEELQLIEGCEQYGVGSWGDIAEHIGGRNTEEVGQHYIRVYIETPTYPMPDMSKTFTVSASEFVEERRLRIERYRAQQAAQGPPKPKIIASVPACHEIQGFMPGRLEFDTEGENDAEVVIKDMVFEPEDSELDIEHKLTVLGIYNERLTRRSERKRVIFTHDLLDYRRLSALEKRRTKEDRDLANKLKPYVRLLSLSEYDEMCDSMLAEQQYRRRIAELQEYRQNGIKTLAVAQKYERDKQTRMASFSRVPARHTMDDAGQFKMRKSAPADQDLDADLLSQQERSLCSQLNISPRAYLAVKEAVFEELVQAGGTLKRKGLKELLHNLDDQKVSRIYDFFQSQNWIS